MWRWVGAVGGNGNRNLSRDSCASQQRGYGRHEGAVGQPLVALAVAMRKCIEQLNLVVYMFPYVFGVFGPSCDLVVA